VARESTSAEGLRRRAGRKARAVVNELFLETNHDLSRTALVLGSGRSGTTWLAEMLARQGRTRILFEPFHPCWVPARAELPLFLDPANSDETFKRAAKWVFVGRIRNRQIDQICAGRLPRARVVKDIHTGNLLPWYRAQFPGIPIVFVVRHPIAASSSRLRTASFYGVGAYLESDAGRRFAEASPVAEWLPLYDHYRQHSDELIRLVAEWCIENAYPLATLKAGDEPPVFYEDVVMDPLFHLGRIADRCKSALGPSATEGLKIADVRRPSAKDWFGTAAAAQDSRQWERALGRWRDQISNSRIDECMRVLADFGLDGFYGDGPTPIGRPRMLDAAR
jgi:hypothetical protein